MALFRKGKEKVLFVATEAAPFAKAGGLGEVMFALPRLLRKLGYDARVMVPRYASVNSEETELTVEKEGLRVPTNGEGASDEEIQELICNVKVYTPKGEKRTPVITYFLENEEYFEKRSNIYGYNDDAIRWALLSRGVLEFLRTSEWIPDVIVAADWQLGFLCNYLKTTYRDDSVLKNIATVFTIHNLRHQGMFDQHFVSEMDFDDGQAGLPSFFDERLLKINGMRRGILHADVISTVSPQYAREIMTEEYGELLDGLLRERRSRVYGILNGIDHDELNPETDTYLFENYKKTSLDVRVKNKRELQSRFGLDEDAKTFLIAIVSRLSEQKGFDLMLPVADVLLRELNIQCAVLGSGDGRYMSFFQELEKNYPGRVGINLTFDPVLNHVVFGGADAVLIPSRFEPSGIVQLEAMRYGAIPIVRKTGGLANTVEDYNPEKETGIGFVFNEFDAQAMMIAITRSFVNYRNKPVWRAIQKRAMEADFSWTASAKEYIHLFGVAIAFRKRELSEEE